MDNERTRLCKAMPYLSAAAGHANGGYWSHDRYRSYLFDATINDLRKAAAELGYDLVPAVANTDKPDEVIDAAAAAA